jgi:hypothetical protein
MAAAGTTATTEVDDRGVDDDSAELIVNELTTHDAIDRVIATYGYPAIRLLIALVIIYMASGVSS